MTSLISVTKQTPANAGYYITISSCLTSIYCNTGTDEVPQISTMTGALGAAGVSTLVNAPGAVLKDMGKTLVSSGRVFRKVQVVANTGADLVTGTAGVGGVDTAPTAYITGFIELPGQHGSGGYYRPTPVARLG